MFNMIWLYHALSMLHVGWMKNSFNICDKMDKKMWCSHWSSFPSFWSFLGHNKSKYDHAHSKCIDVDYIIFIVIMSYNTTNEVYTLDKIDAEELKKFVTKNMYKVHVRGMAQHSKFEQFLLHSCLFGCFLCI